ncbi:MAG: TonB-dependent receptor [bacterium]
MRRSRILGLAWGLAAVLASAPAWSQEEAQKGDLGQLVVSARKLEEPLKTTAHSVSVVTGEELERRVDRSVAEGLRELPGVVVQSLGTRGETVNIRLRGATAADTLVLLDGVRLNNPATNETNLGLIPVEQIDRIEVLRGSQAVLYGGSAVGGVINIISKQGQDPSATHLSLEGGNLGHRREWLGNRNQKGITRWNVGVSRTDETGQFQNDDFGETALTQRWDLEPIEKLRLTLASHIYLSKKNLAREFLIGPAPLYDPALPMDAFFLQVAPDLNRVFDRLLTTQSLQLAYEWNEHFRTELVYGFLLSDEEEKNSNLGDSGIITPSGLALAPNSVLNKVKSERQSVDLRQFFFFPKVGGLEQSVTVGFEFYDERVHTDGQAFPGDPPPSPASLAPLIPPQDKLPAPGIPADRQNYAPYFQYHLGFKDRLFVDAGFRFDDNSAYGNELSPRAALAVLIPEVNGKFHGAYGEGFLPPTIIQLFNPISGNPNLKPQLTQSYEAGYEQHIGDRATLYATFFYLDFDNLIDRLGNNINDAFSTGVESGFDVKITRRLRVGANYTFTHTVDESGGGGRLPNVPAHVFNAVLSANPWRKLTVDSTLSIVSSQKEVFPIVSPDGRFVGGNPAASLLGGVNSGYVLWDIALAYDFDLNAPGHPQSIKVFGKASNILNDQYEEVFGFPSPGFHFIAGADVLF